MHQRTTATSATGADRGVATMFTIHPTIAHTFVREHHRRLSETSPMGRPRRSAVSAVDCIHE